MSATPKLGRNARLLKSGVSIGYGKNVSFEAKAEIIKEYSMDSVSPAVTGSGQQTYTWKMDRLYTDNTYLNLLIAGTTFDLIFAPEGTPKGATQKFTTLNTCTILSFSRSAGETGGILENISGEAQSLTPEA